MNTSRPWGDSIRPRKDVQTQGRPGPKARHCILAERKVWSAGEQGGKEKSAQAGKSSQVKCQVVRQRQRAGYSLDATTSPQLAWETPTRLSQHGKHEHACSCLAKPPKEGTFPLKDTACGWRRSSTSQGTSTHLAAPAGDLYKFQLFSPNTNKNWALEKTANALSEEAPGHWVFISAVYFLFG